MKKCFTFKVVLMVSLFLVLSGCGRSVAESTTETESYSETEVMTAEVSEFEETEINSETEVMTAENSESDRYISNGNMEFDLSAVSNFPEEPYWTDFNSDKIKSFAESSSIPNFIKDDFNKNSREGCLEYPLENEILKILFENGEFIIEIDSETYQSPHFYKVKENDIWVIEAINTRRELVRIICDEMYIFSPDVIIENVDTVGMEASVMKTTKEMTLVFLDGNFQWIRLNELYGEAVRVEAGDILPEEFVWGKITTEGDLYVYKVDADKNSVEEIKLEENVQAKNIEFNHHFPTQEELKYRGFGRQKNPSLNTYVRRDGSGFIPKSDYSGIIELEDLYGTPGRVKIYNGEYPYMIVNFEEYDIEMLYPLNSDEFSYMHRTKELQFNNFYEILEAATTPME